MTPCWFPSAAVQRNGVQAFVYKLNSNHTASIQNIVEQTTDGNMSANPGAQPGRYRLHHRF